MPVGDIPQIEGHEGGLSGPPSRLQYLMDHAVPLNQQRHHYLPDFMSSDSQRPTFLLRRRSMGHGDDRV